MGKNREPQNHHYVPRVYIKQWEDSEKLLWVYNKVGETYFHKSKNHILSEKNLYALTIEQFLYMTLEEKKVLIEPLAPFDVYLDGEKLYEEDILEKISEFDDFVIQKDGKTISNKYKLDIKDKICRKKVLTIEKKYQIIENEWKDIVDFFERYRKMFVQGNIIFPVLETVEDYGKKLLNFICSMYTRNPFATSKLIYNVEQKNSRQLEKEQVYTVFEELQKNYLENKRHLLNIEKYNLHLCFTDGSSPFFTCDNPVIINGVSEKYAGIWFPVSPTIFAALSAKHGERMLVEPCILAKEKVNDLNIMVKENAVEVFISSVDIKDSAYKFIQQ